MEGVRGESSACDVARTVLMERWPVLGHPPLSPQGSFFLRFHWIQEIIGVGLVPERNNEFTF